MESEPWHLDSAGVLTAGDLHVVFTSQSRMVVALLAAADLRYVSNDTLVRAIWGHDGGGGDGTNGLSVVVHRIRAQLRRAGFPPVLQTAWGYGYRWLSVTTVVDGPTLVPTAHVLRLERLLASHPDREAAELLHWACFGV